MKTGIYRHFKGQMYLLLETATHSETEETYVVYKALYGEQGIWVRPLALFDDEVRRDGKVQKRFVLMENHEQNEHQN